MTVARTLTNPVLDGIPTITLPSLVALGAHAGGVTRFVRQTGAPYEFPDAYGSMTAALAASKSADSIVLLSDLREEVTFPNYLFDLTVFGAATRPRHDDKHNFTTTPQIGAASWRNSSGVTTTPLATLRSQGTRFVNILFDAPTTAACIELIRNNASGSSEYDSSHAQFIGCRFASGETGIEVIGTENLFNVLVQNCVFQDLTDGIKGLSAYRWRVEGNRFVKCTNCIDVAAVETEILNNVMVYAPTKGFDLTGGSRNTVAGNVIAGDYNVINVAGTNDSWGGNTHSGETTAQSLTDPTGS